MPRPGEPLPIKGHDSHPCHHQRGARPQLQRQPRDLYPIPMQWEQCPLSSALNRGNSPTATTALLSGPPHRIGMMPTLPCIASTEMGSTSAMEVCTGVLYCLVEQRSTDALLAHVRWLHVLCGWWLDTVQLLTCAIVHVQNLCIESKKNACAPMKHVRMFHVLLLAEAHMH